jgi:metal-responsive CopG/Arc/MetJ family transcriptional regulator
MKEKTSVTLSPDVLTGIDRLAGSKRSRSALIDDVLRQYLREKIRAHATSPFSTNMRRN